MDRPACLAFQSVYPTRPIHPSHPFLWKGKKKKKERTKDHSRFDSTGLHISEVVHYHRHHYRSLFSPFLSSLTNIHPSHSTCLTLSYFLSNIVRTRVAVSHHSPIQLGRRTFRRPAPFLFPQLRTLSSRQAVSTTTTPIDPFPICCSVTQPFWPVSDFCNTTGHGITIY